MEADAEFEVPAWSQICNMPVSQAEKIRRSGFQSDVVVGVTRGEWVPVRVLADLLEITAPVTVGVAETRSEPVLMCLAGEHVKQRGATEVLIATVYYEPLSVIKPDYYEKETCGWVVSRDAKETVRKIVEKQRDVQAIKREIAKLVKAGLSEELVKAFLKEVLEAGKC